MGSGGCPALSDTILYKKSYDILLVTTKTFLCSISSHITYNYIQFTMSTTQTMKAVIYKGTHAIPALASQLTSI